MKIFGLLNILPGWIWACICAGTIATTCTQSFRLSREQSVREQTKSEFSDYRSKQERLMVEASEKARNAEQELSDVQSQSQAKTKVLYQQLTIARNSADMASQRLRDAAKAVISSGEQHPNPGVVPVSQTTGTGSALLSNVLAEIDDIAGVMAEEADRRRIAGLQCESEYAAAVKATR